MASPVYGTVKFSKVNGMPKITCQVNTKLKVVADHFDANGNVYVPINSQRKSLSLTLNEFRELMETSHSFNNKILLDFEVSDFVF